MALFEIWWPMQGLYFATNWLQTCANYSKLNTFSSPHHLQGDGKCERMNQTLIKSYNENKELFYTRNKIAPQSQTQPQTQSQTDSSQSDWLEIKRISSRKKIKGKDTWLVYWMDGTNTREPTENITDYAKTMYYLAQNERRRRRRRRRRT